jgi:hypothetical protein
MPLLTGVVSPCCWFCRGVAEAGARRGGGGSEAAGAAGRGGLRLLPTHGHLRLRGALPLQPPASSSRRRGERPLLLQPFSALCFFSRLALLFRLALLHPSVVAGARSTPAILIMTGALNCISAGWWEMSSLLKS